MKNISQIICALILLSVCGCEHDNNAAFFISDPEGTKTLVISNNSSSCLQLGEHQILMNRFNNFVSSSSVLFFCCGEKEYLLEIDSLQPSGWKNEIAVLPGNGYIICLEGNEENDYVRLVVQDYTVDSKGISGAIVKYQHPWHPSNEKAINPTVDGKFIDPNFKNLEDCDNTIDKCWEVVRNTSETFYVWCTEYIIVYVMQQSAADKYKYREAVGETEYTCNEQKDPPTTDDSFIEYWNNSTWHFIGVMTCDGENEQEFTITFHNVNKKTYTSDLPTKYWLTTNLNWEDYSGARITLRGYDDGHTSFDFDYVDANTVKCEYHHWNTNGEFCLANFEGHRTNY